MEITRHAVNAYLERIKGIEKEEATKDDRHEAREKIREVVEDPAVIYRGEKVYEGKEDSAPIYIRGDIAVPVTNHNERPGDIAIPTTYPSDTFTEKIHAHAGE